MSLITVIHIYLKIECIKNRKKINCGKDINDKNLYNLSKKKKKTLQKLLYFLFFFYKKKKTIVPKYEIRYKFLYFFISFPIICFILFQNICFIGFPIFSLHSSQK